MTTTYFVTRHQGALDWAREEGYVDDDVRVVATLAAQSVQAGDLVIGTLPAHLAAHVVARGARYQHLVLDITEAQRGQELSAEAMRQCGAKLEELYIQTSEVTRPRQAKEILHVCIASQQTLPSLIPTQLPAIQPSAVVILASKKMLAEANRLKYGLTKSGCNEGNVKIRNDLPDEGIQAIVNYGNDLADWLRGNYPQHRWLLNATGGTKPMALGLLQALRPYVEAIYCDTDHESLEFLHPPGRNAIRLNPDLLNVEKCLAAQGFIRRPEQDRSKVYLSRHSTTRKLVEKAKSLDAHFGAINWVSMRALNEPNGTFKPKHFLQDKPTGLGADMLKIYQEQGLVQWDGDTHLTFADQEAARYLSGGWLEEWCWLVGQELEAAKLDQRLTRKRWGINVEIDPYDTQSKPQALQNPLNELDAVFVHRNRMLIIECKTGTQVSEKGKAQEILNKMEVLGEHAAGRFATKWLLSARPLPPTGQIQDRAKRYHIKLVSPAELPELKERILDWMRNSK